MKKVHPLGHKIRDGVDTKHGEILARIKIKRKDYFGK
jgi:hypothetical protein